MEPDDLEAIPPESDEAPTPYTPPPPEALGRRKKMAFWDRSKIILLLAALWGILVWKQLSDVPIMSVHDALAHELRRAWLLPALAAVELLRQIHYLVCEHSARWHRFWTEGVFGTFEHRVLKVSDWNRYRLGRVLKWLFVFAVISAVLGAAFHTSPATAWFLLPARVVKAAPVIFEVMFLMIFAVGQFAAIFWFLSKGGTEVYFPDDIKTRFSDVWGQDAVLERVRENVLFLENPEKVEEKGGYVPSGILLWGPPGTGKTLMAEAVAGETGKPFVFVDPGAFINMFFGVGILKVKSLFRKLRKLAVRYGGVIVFFDEADALGNRGAIASGGQFGKSPAAAGIFSNSCHGGAYLDPRTASLLLSMASGGGTTDGFIMGMPTGGGGGGMGTLQALLTELSGLKKPRGFWNRSVRRALGMKPKPPPKYRILVMMATNMPQALDEALLRPGRLDRIYRVGYPAKEGRKRTYEGYLNKVKHTLTDADIDKLATITPYATGATIKDMVNEALVVAVRDDRDTVTYPDMLKAKMLKSLGPPEDVEYIERERHATALHEACHAVAAYRVRSHLTIDLATIEKGQAYLGMVSSIPIEEQFTHWRTEYEADLVVSLASLAGERMFFGEDNSSGVSGDLQSATALSMAMDAYWGMGRTIGSRQATLAPANAMAIADGSSFNMLETNLGNSVETRLYEIYQRAWKLLEDNRFEVLAVTHALETYKTITGDDVDAIMRGVQGPLIDGRVYHRPEFILAAEAYHEQALAAHRQHSAMPAPLPVLEPFEAGEAPADGGSTSVYAPAPDDANGDSNGDANGDSNGDDPAPLGRRRAGGTRGTGRAGPAKPSLPDEG